MFASGTSPPSPLSQSLPLPSPTVFSSLFFVPVFLVLIFILFLSSLSITLHLFRLLPYTFAFRIFFSLVFPFPFSNSPPPLLQFSPSHPLALFSRCILPFITPFLAFPLPSFLPSVFTISILPFLTFLSPSPYFSTSSFLSSLIFYSFSCFPLFSSSCAFSPLLPHEGRSRALHVRTENTAIKILLTALVSQQRVL